MFAHNWRTLFFNVAVTCSAMFVAMAPPVFLLWSLDNFAKQKAQAALQDVALRMTAYADGALNEGADALASIAPSIRQTCGEEAKTHLRALLAQSSFIRDIAAVSPQGQIMCSTSEAAQLFAKESNFRAARSKSIGVAFTPAGKDRPALIQLRWQEGINSLYAFISPNVLRSDFIPSEWNRQARGAIMLDDGTVLHAIDIQSSHDFPETEKVISVETVSQRFPIKVNLAVQENVVMAPYRTVGMLIGAGGSLLAIMLIVFVLQALRRRPHAEDAIAAGIKNREFIPYFQPVMNLQTGELLGCEVLIRWRKRDGTIIPPGVFIQKAEESGLAVEMTRQLMEKVRDQIGRYYAGRPHLKVAFNLFAGHFSDLSTVDDVREIFKEGGIRFSQIVLEVTERYPLPNMSRALTAIGALQNLGCKVALDDAGTGHGGLAYLQQLGMDQVKIDKLFVDTITEGVTAAPIIDSMIEMAKRMNMEVVAEGVETLAQFEYLKNRGVTAAQGYLFAKPMPLKAYIKLIENMSPLDDGKRGTIVYLDVA
jgi:sensor c-di-GMP phosphodiesterase-like protein